MPSTHGLYAEDAYPRELEVFAVDPAGRCVALDRTIFFPGGRRNA